MKRQGRRSIKWNSWILLTLLLSVVSLFVEQSDFSGITAIIFTNLIDFVIFFILLAEIIVELRRAPYKIFYLRRNWSSLSFSLAFIALFIYTKALTVANLFSVETSDGSAIVAIRNLFLVLKVFSRYRRIATVVESLRIRPALTIALSFLLVILAGSWLLMMPFTAVSGPGLPFIDALFTATSAVCVTGLIVVDTAVYFSAWGRIVIMALIQIGGLGIMVLSYFTLFIFRRRVSVEQKRLVSYMLSEDDMSSLSRVLRSIIGITLAVELAGAILLALGFRSSLSNWGDLVLYGVFHAVSAFCNAGFALFSDSLMSFTDNPLVLLVVALLIICGGLSFAVIANIGDSIRGKSRLTENSKAVLTATGILILAGMILVYPLEHQGALSGLNLGQQYLAAFFQSVTLRTAGFNSVSFDSLATGTIVGMIFIMFIGGASGSTAGGVKVNTVSVLLASVRSSWRNEERVLIHSKTVDPRTVNQAFLILLFGILAVFGGTFLLSLTETAPMKDLLFESASAFATVGLSTGVTGSLGGFGKSVVIVLMFIGRLGPLTVLAAASSDAPKNTVGYPRASITVG